MKKDLFTVALQNSVKSGSVSALNEKTLKACEMNPKDYKDTVNALYRAVLNGNEDMIFRVWKYLLSMLEGSHGAHVEDVDVMRRAAMSVRRKADTIKHDDGTPDAKSMAYGSIVAPSQFRSVVEMILAYRSMGQMATVSDNGLKVEEEKSLTRKQKMRAKEAKKKAKKA